MRIIILIFFSFSCFLFPAEKTFIREYTYIANWLDTKETSRAIALNEVKILLMEEVGVYISSELNIDTKSLLKDKKYKMDETVDQKLTSITAGITKTTLLEEKWKKKLGKSKYWLKAKIVLDPDNIQNKIREIIDNKKILTELESYQKQTADAMAQIELLKKQLAESESDKEKLRNKYEKEANIVLANSLSLEGWFLLKQGNFSEAMPLLLRASKLNPNIYDFSNLGAIYANLGNYSESIIYYEKALDIDSEFAPIYNNIAYTYQSLENYTKSNQAFLKFIQLCPNCNDVPTAYYNIGRNYFFLEDFPESNKYLQKSIDSDPYNPIFYEGWTTMLIWQGNKQQKWDSNRAKAISVLENAVKLKLKHIPLYKQLSIWYFEDGDTTGALSMLKKAIELNPKNEESYSNLYDFYYNIGLNHFENKSYKKAIRSFKKSIGIKPDEIESYDYLAYTYYTIADWFNTYKWYKKAARLGHKPSQDFLSKNGMSWIDVDSSEYELTRIAEYYRLVGNISKKEETINKLIKLKPDDENYYYYLAQTERQKGNYVDAITFLEKSINISPEFVAAHGELGFIYNRLDNHDKSIQHFSKFFEILEGQGVTEFPNYSLFSSYISSSYLKLKNYSKAIEYSTQAINSDPKKAEGYFALAAIYDSQGNKAKQVEVLEKALNSSDSKSTNLLYFELSRIYGAQGNYDESIRILEDAIKLFSNDDKILGRIYYNLGIIYHARNDIFKEAYPYYKKSANLNYQAAIDYLTENNLTW